jgi:hypothetical protein
MKAAKISVYSLAGAVFVTALVLFFTYTIHAPMNVGEGGEALGWVTAGSMAFLLLLFVLRCIFLSKKTTPETKMKLAPYYKILNQLHGPVGCLALALLSAHFSLVFDLTNPAWRHFVTGYILVGLLLALSGVGLAGVLNKTPSRKTLILVHQILVALILVTFVIHLIFK